MGAAPKGDREPLAASSARAVSVYNASTLTEHKIQEVSELRALQSSGAVVWVSVEGMPDSQQLAELADIFHLHLGIVNQLTKPFPGVRFEKYASQRLISTRMFRLVDGRCVDENVQIIFARSFVISIQDGVAGDCLDAVRNRLRNEEGYIRQESGEHLAISVIDAVIDSYFHLLDKGGDALDTLEDDILIRHDRYAPANIHAVKREISKVRHTVWPMRDALNAYYRDASDAMSKHTQVLLRDCTENAVHVMQMVETQRELCSDLMDLHLSTASARMNEVMKVLTIITTLFIPPTFIAGIYGMNFNPDKSPWNMPELNWFFGYPFALGLMLFMVVGLLWFLKRRGCFQREVLNNRRLRRDHDDRA
jgi:magnesium transporter